MKSQSFELFPSDLTGMRVADNLSYHGVAFYPGYIFYLFLNTCASRGRVFPLLSQLIEGQIQLSSPRIYQLLKFVHGLRVRFNCFLLTYMIRGITLNRTDENTLHRTVPQMH